MLRGLRRALAALAFGTLLLGGAAAVVAAARQQAAPLERSSPAVGLRSTSTPVVSRARAPRPRAQAPQIRWRRSTSQGVQWAGRLADGVQLPVQGHTFFTWDPILRRAPNRGWRRWGNDRMVRVLLQVLEDYAAAHPTAARVGIGDLSRPHGGDFGVRYGWPGHVSHQNGLDVDVYYPRRDRRERAPARAAQIDRELAQDLVRRFVRAGAARVFVGPRTQLTGPPRIVQVLPHHDNHLHARFPASPVRREMLGRSVRGRAITAAAIGDPAGPKRLLVVGSIHGDEPAGLSVTRALERLLPPAGVDVWIVHTFNPDGLAAGTRQNARGVDLNRNFPVAWRRAGRPFEPMYPGPRPFSERETRIAARLILRLRPRYTVWFHQPQTLVRGWDGSVRAARRYARLVGMRFRALPSPRGAATRWQHARLPRTEAFVVELAPGPLDRKGALRHARALLRLHD